MYISTSVLISLVPVDVNMYCVVYSKWLDDDYDVQVLNEASVEDNLIDLGPGSPAVVTPRASTAATPTPPSSLTAAASAPSLSTQLAGLSKTHTNTITQLKSIIMVDSDNCHDPLHTDGRI